jgi:hypothetical protein
VVVLAVGVLAVGVLVVGVLVVGVPVVVSGVCAWAAKGKSRIAPVNAAAAAPVVVYAMCYLRHRLNVRWERGGARRPHLLPSQAT